MSHKNVKAVIIRFFQSHETVKVLACNVFLAKTFELNALLTKRKLLLQLTCSIAACKIN